MDGRELGHAHEVNKLGERKAPFIVLAETPYGRLSNNGNANLVGRWSAKNDVVASLDVQWMWSHLTSSEFVARGVPTVNQKAIETTGL